MSGQFEKIGLEAVMAIPLMLIYHLIFNYARLVNIYDMKSLRSKHRRFIQDRRQR